MVDDVTDLLARLEAANRIIAEQGAAIARLHADLGRALRNSTPGGGSTDMATDRREQAGAGPGKPAASACSSSSHVDVIVYSACFVVPILLFQFI